MRVVWVHRDEAEALDVPSVLAPRSADLPDGVPARATGAREHTTTERNVFKANLDFVGYWRHGHAAM